jgi:hypothetical protein
MSSMGYLDMYCLMCVVSHYHSVWP